MLPKVEAGGRNLRVPSRASLDAKNNDRNDGLKRQYLKYQYVHQYWLLGRSSWERRGTWRVATINKSILSRSVIRRCADEVLEISDLHFSEAVKATKRLNSDRFSPKKVKCVH